MELLSPLRAVINAGEISNHPDGIDLILDGGASVDPDTPLSPLNTLIYHWACDQIQRKEVFFI